MLGFYDYTVILTYLSAVSASIGIFVSLQGNGHPYMGVFFLMVCGLCDAFDGKVARMKKDRTEAEKKFGIQIDSLSDLIAFGVLPACIGNAMIRVSPKIPEIPRVRLHSDVGAPLTTFLFLVLILYVLAALIRLAYFNVMEEERQQKEAGVRKSYDGLPVTSSSLIFPSVMLIQFLTETDITPIYFIAIFITGCLFVSNIKIPKPGMRGILIMIGIGAVEFAILAFEWFWVM